MYNKSLSSYESDDPENSVKNRALFVSLDSDEVVNNLKNRSKKTSAKKLEEK